MRPRPSLPTNQNISPMTFWRARGRRSPRFSPPTSSGVNSTTAKPDDPPCASNFSMMVRPAFGFSWRMTGIQAGALDQVGNLRLRRVIMAMDNEHVFRELDGNDGGLLGYSKVGD